MNRFMAINCQDIILNNELWSLVELGGICKYESINNKYIREEVLKDMEM